MSERMRDEYQAKDLKAESSSKVLGFVFVLLSLVVFGLGLMMHLIQTGGLPNDTIVNILILQLHMKFATDYFVGFFSGIFIVLGITYIRQKPKESEGSAET